MTAPTATIERAPQIATLLVAFASDPVNRWVYPDTDRYLAHFPELLQLVCADAFAAGTADQTAHGEGAAMWLPPGTPSDDDALVDLVQRSVRVERHDEVFAFLERLNDHHPTGPHWYLPFMGVDPCHQGQGHGSWLLEHGLARSDRDRLPAYLDATTPRNRALYERHGFQVVGEVRGGGSPPMWAMLRPPR